MTNRSIIKMTNHNRLYKKKKHKQKLFKQEPAKSLNFEIRIGKNKRMFRCFFKSVQFYSQKVLATYVSVVWGYSASDVTCPSTGLESFPTSHKHSLHTILVCEHLHATGSGKGRNATESEAFTTTLVPIREFLEGWVQLRPLQPPLPPPQRVDPQPRSPFAKTFFLLIIY